ncbi:TraB/GumN family protein [Thermomonas alba]|uniref:TraB/GumN family protein n=1 Tax=Thermomonas alba TaxID=2888525 RepID=UPI001F04230E|nr:TraB/GumN family protein [Thermomonas alba]
MSLRRLFLLLCLVLVAPISRADAPAAAYHPLLWKVSDADSAVYLLGAFHLLKVDDYPLPAEVERAFDDSAALLFEVDPAAMTSPDTLAAMRKYTALSDGKTLGDVLPKTTLDRLGVLVAASGGSLQALEHSEPWAVNLSLTLGITQALGLRADLGLDRYLMQRAAQAGKPVAGLETVEAQLQAMDGVPYAEQVQQLEEFLADPPRAARQLQDLHAWWRAGDADRLDAEMRAEMARKTPESYRLLDVERNQAWLPQLEKRLADSHRDNILVVVGALHLLGPDGLVEQLRARGYKVERICDGCALPVPTAH